MRLNLPFTFVWLTGLVVCASAFGADIELTVRGPDGADYFAPVYFEDALKLEPLDTVRFGDGKSYTIAEVIGHGKTTLVLKVKEKPGLVMRIPLAIMNSEYIGETIRGEAVLNELGIEHVKVHTEDSTKHRIFVEEIEGAKTLAEIMHGSKLGLSNEQYVKLLEWGTKTAFLVEGLDFRPDQLAWDAKKSQWTLLDWAQKTTKLYEPQWNPVEWQGRMTIFDSFPTELKMNRIGRAPSGEWVGGGSIFKPLSKKEKRLRLFLNAYQSMVQERRAAWRPTMAEYRKLAATLGHREQPAGAFEYIIKPFVTCSGLVRSIK